MSPRRPESVSLACGLLLWIAGLLLPRRARSEWLAEWRAELHYVLGCCVSHRVCIVFAIGAVPDALWIRRHALPRAAPLESPHRCIVVLAVCGAATVALALVLPGLRREIIPPAYQGPDDIATISRTPSFVGSGMQISAAEYLAWSTHAPPALSRTAFYEPVTSTAEFGGRAQTWFVGRATENLAALLHIPVAESLLQECRRTGSTPLVLSRSAWVHDFGANRKIVGRALQVSGRREVIVAVAPEIASDLPMQMDAWSLEGDDAIAQLASQRFNYGYMLAQWAPASGSDTRDVGNVALTSDDGSSNHLYTIPLSVFAEYNRRLPEIDFLLSLFMTCLMLPAMLFIFLQSGLVTERLSLRMRTRGWFFLIAKVALLLPLLYCGPLLIAHILAGAPASEHAIQTYVTMCAALASAWWIFDDQRQRCPHCLRKLTSPARVGERSRSFLAFSGMEFVCAEGHGLLHVPDYPTSWFASQRWLSLDSSWRALFQPGH